MLILQDNIEEKELKIYYRDFRFYIRRLDILKAGQTVPLCK